jgi:hypothetical protein
VDEDAKGRSNATSDAQGFAVAHQGWGGSELTLVGVIYTAVVGAMLSVVITVTSDWRWVFVYAATSLALLAWILNYKSFSVRLARRYLAWKGLGRGS